MSLVLVDSSVWINVFGSARGVIFDQGKIERCAVCPPIVQEVVQGIKDERAYLRIREGFLSMPCFGNPVTTELYLSAAEIFRAGRRRGFTIRSGVDCLIAAVALKSGLPVWHRDRDFDLIAKYTDLRVVEL